MSNKVFLETTVQIDRNFSNLPIRNEIDDNLKDKELLSSSYVLGEMKFNLLRNAITFYNLLQECTTTNEALDRICSVVYSTGQYSRVLKVFSFLTEDGKMDKVNVERRLNMLIESLDADTDTTKSNVCDIIKVLKEIRECNKKPYGQRCWKIADAIISNEVSADSLLCTTNNKDYEPICKKLNKRIISVTTT